MRGAHRKIVARHVERRIIPAYAGSTMMPSAGTPRARDHPRVCGEHSVQSTYSLVWPGSSPRMRGARVNRLLHLPHRGIIPAYAGSTTQPSQRPLWQRDHPRVCGEHEIDMADGHGKIGSSPRMRGARRGWRRPPSRSGIIPAYAGSTLHEVHRSDSKAQFLYGCQGSANQ